MKRLALPIICSVALLAQGHGAAADPGSAGLSGGNTADAGPLRQVALGVARPGGRDLEGLDAFAASIGGQPPAIWVVWSRWGSEQSRDFPTAVVEGLADRGVTPMIWWEPVDPSEPTDPTYPRHRNTVRGDHDDYIRDFARDARSFGGTVLLRLAHEANGSYFPWSIERFDNSARTFIRAWRHVHDIFVEEGASNVRFVWSVSKQRCPGGCDPYAQVFPGDAYVDIVGLSSHNWGATRDTWVPLYEGAERAAGHLARLSTKPLMLVEVGSDGVGGDKPAWIRQGYVEVYDRLPRVTAIVYLDADLRGLGHPDWRLSSPSEALAAFAEVAAMPAFGTAAPPADGVAPPRIRG